MAAHQTAASLRIRTAQRGAGGSLEQSAWLSVLGAYDLANDLNWVVLEGLSEPLSDEDKALFRAPWLAVRMAEEVLAILDLSPELVGGRTAAQHEATAGLEKRYWSKPDRVL